VGLTIPTFSSLKTFGPALAGLFFIPGGMYWHWAPISLLASVHHFRWQQCFQGGADPPRPKRHSPRFGSMWGDTRATGTIRHIASLDAFETALATHWTACHR
jgi:hypothetical protein